ncbi:MAG TPA: sulfotransferase [Defluviitoga sp.]|nr:sulfotransferase [Defluviitoga sp.]HOP24229.1 sulfotransferase [Defluviitoga sp.]HPZ28179.1 sulfotransferase [Defluviitoga sp.]HQD62069.1 sulfotransferase [Defluviitoga sp.]
MESVFNKHCVFITSTGRTGTQFLAKSLNQMIEDCYSVHEPANVFFKDLKKWARDIKRFGLFQMTVGQFLPSKSMCKLSTYRRIGKISDEKTKEYIKGLRKQILEETKESIYVESSNHLHGVVDLLEDVFPNCKIVFIIRDPRTWIRSAISSPVYLLYKTVDLAFLEMSMRPYHFKDDPYCDKWKNMSKFERYCWYYNKLNTFVLDSMKDKKNFRLYRYEDLFLSKSRNEFFLDFLEFCSKFSDGFSRKYQFKPELLDKKLNSSADNYKLPHWKEWDRKMAQKMHEHCGKLMERFGYGKEPEWINKLGLSYEKEFA